MKYLYVQINTSTIGFNCENKFCEKVLVFRSLWTQLDVRWSHVSQLKGLLCFVKKVLADLGVASYSRRAGIRVELAESYCSNFSTECFAIDFS